MTDTPHPSLEVAGDVLFVKGISIAYAHFDILQVLEDNPQVGKIHFNECLLVVTPNDETEIQYAEGQLFAGMIEALIERLPRYTPSVIKFEKCQIGQPIHTNERTKDKEAFYGLFKMMFIDCTITNRDFKYHSYFGAQIFIKNMKGGDLRFHSNYGNLTIEAEWLDDCSVSFIGNQDRDGKHLGEFSVTLKDPKTVNRLQMSGYKGHMKISGYHMRGKFLSQFATIEIGEDSKVALDIFSADVDELWVSVSDITVRFDQSKLRYYRVYQSTVVFLPYGDKSGYEDSSIGWGNASGARTFFSPSEWLNYHLEIGTYMGERGYFCYKTFSKSKPAPYYWTITDGQVLRENVAMSDWQECAAGVNVAPIGWKDLRPDIDKVWKLFIPMRYLADVEITQPRFFASPEKFRTAYAVIVERVQIREEQERVNKVLNIQRHEIYKRVKSRIDAKTAPALWNVNTQGEGLMSGWHINMFSHAAFLVDVENQSSLMDIYNRSNWLNDTPDKHDPLLYNYILKDEHTAEETTHTNLPSALDELIRRLHGYGDEEVIFDIDNAFAAEIFTELIDGVIYSRQYINKDTDVEYTVSLHAQKKEGYTRE